MSRKADRIQDRNGVKVRVYEHENGTTVEATCECFGSPRRLHTNPDCPLLKKAETGTRDRRQGGVT